MIDKIKEKAYHLFGVLILINFIFAFIHTLLIKERNIDIQLHDFYFVISYTHVFNIISIFLFVLWGFYILLEKYLWAKTLTWIHVVSTSISFFLIFHFLGFILFTLLSPSVPRRYYSFNEIESFRQYSFINDLISFFAIILFLSQFLFFINIIGGVVINLRKSP